MAGAAPTNFSVVRVKRDILRRSSVGADGHRPRSMRRAARATNEAYGLDGTFAFFTNLAINTYWARTQTDGPRRRRHELPRAARLRRAIDTACSSSVWSSARPSTLRSASCGATTCAGAFGRLRFSPRPSDSAVGPQVLRDRSARLHRERRRARWRRASASCEFAVEFQNGDRFRVGYTGTYEFLPAPFPIATGVTVPVGGYDFDNVDVGFNRAARQRVSGKLSVEHGTFYNGHKTAFGVSSGRVNLSPRFSVEPTYSVNWVDLPQGSFTTQLVGSRVTYTATPLMFASALVQYNSEQPRDCRPTCACVGSTGPAASCSSCSTRSGTR